MTEFPIIHYATCTWYAIIPWIELHKLIIFDLQLNNNEVNQLKTMLRIWMAAVIILFGQAYMLWDFDLAIVLFICWLFYFHCIVCKLIPLHIWQKLSRNIVHKDMKEEDVYILYSKLCLSIKQALVYFKLLICIHVLVYLYRISNLEWQQPFLHSCSFDENCIMSSLCMWYCYLVSWGNYTM